MQIVVGAGCWPGEARGTVVWHAAERHWSPGPVPDRGGEVRRFRTALSQAAADLETWADGQPALEGRMLLQQYKEALLTDAWSQRACLLIDSAGKPAAAAGIEAAEAVGTVFRRSPELRERADALAEAARWLAGRLEPITFPAGAIVAAHDLSPLVLLDLGRPALISGPQPPVVGATPLVWGVPSLTPEWAGRYVAVRGTEITLDASTSEAALPYAEVREAVRDKARRMMHDGLVRLTSGNISCRVPGANLFAITPSGMDYETLELSDICIVDMNGQVADGIRRPSTEMPMHRLTYQRRPDVGAVVHTHSIHASAFACTGQEMPVISTELAMVVGATVRCAPYARSGTEEFARAAVDALGEEDLAVLFQNHGVMTVGRTLKDAYAVAVAVEEAAQIYVLARQMGTPLIIPEAERQRMFREFRRSYGQPGNQEE